MNNKQKGYVSKNDTCKPFLIGPFLGSVSYPGRSLFFLDRLSKSDFA